MDERSFSLTRGRFVRVCVELDLEQPLTEGVWVGEQGEDFFQIVSYENVPSLCSSCGCLGHSTQNCMNVTLNSDQVLAGNQDKTPIENSSGSSPANKDKSPQTQASQVELPEVGRWIRVQRGRGRRTPARQPAGVMHKSNIMEDDATLGHTANPGLNLHQKKFWLSTQLPNGRPNISSADIHNSSDSSAYAASAKPS